MPWDFLFSAAAEIVYRRRGELPNCNIWLWVKNMDAKMAPWQMEPFFPSAFGPVVRSPNAPDDFDEYGLV